MSKDTRKLVCHMGKFKKNDLMGLQIHNQRERESRRNRNIDRTRSHLNYDLHNPQPINYHQAAKQRIESVLDKKPRKDANWCVEAELSAGRKFWESASKEERERFFEESYRFMCGRFGKENILYSMVHLDETSPHMHCGFTPFTKDGKLNSQKTIMNRKDLGRIHIEFFKHMKQRGLNIEKGEPAKEKHKQPEIWKGEQVEKKKKELTQLTKRAEAAQQTLGKFAEVAKKSVTRIEEMKQEKENLEQELEPLRQSKARAVNLSALNETAAGFLGMDRERVEVNRERLEEMKEQVIQIPRLLGDLNRSKQENALFSGHIQRMGEQMQGMREELTSLREFAEQYKEAPDLEKYVQALELKLDLIEEELGIEFDLEPDLDDSEELDDEDQPRKKRRRSPRYKLRRRLRKNARRHQNARRPGRNREQQKNAREQKQTKHPTKREHGQIIDRGRF